jgi:hypothetical protein
VSRKPDFDDLVGENVAGDERERLLQVHELLLEAGPPPELSPELETPTLGMTMAKKPKHKTRRSLMLLAASLTALVLAFVIGYAAGNGSDKGLSAARTMQLYGTKLAPDARASLRVEPVDAAGNIPMTLGATGLSKLPPRGYYTVWLMRGPKPLAPCGTFVVEGKDNGVSVSLNAPYPVKSGDWWAVTRQLPGQRDFGTLVMTPQKPA